MRLKGVARNRDGEIQFEADEIVLQLSHGRSIVIRRSEDGVALHAGICRENRTFNARFAVRPVNFSALDLNLEPAK